MNENINTEEQANQEVASQKHENVSIEELISDAAIAEATIASLEDKISKLEKDLNECEETKQRYWKYYSKAEDKVKLLIALIKSGMNGSDFMSAGEFVEKVIDNI